MAKKTRTELSTLAINTNLPDNTTELITPTTERAQLTDERESVVNYKDDLGGVPNAGKFLTVAVDGESLTMVDEPTGELSGSGDAARIAFWSAAKVLTYDDYLSWNTSTDTLNAFIVNATSKLIAAIIDSPEGNSITLSTQPTGGTLTPRLTISSGGLATFSNGIQFANPTPAYKVAATTLDAYEEGTWTALLTTAGNPFNNQSNQTGNYTRIGNLVTIQVQVLLSGATSGGTGEVIVTGLPFTCSSSQAAYGSFNTGRVALSNTLGSSISIPASTNHIRFLFVVSGANANVLDASALNGQGTPYISMTITYQV